MGQLVNGVWQIDPHRPYSPDGQFQRTETQFRNWITADGSSGFQSEPQRYHLYVSLACPWAQRTLIFRILKILEDVISVSIVDPVMREEGWVFGEAERSSIDPLPHVRHIHEIYTCSMPNYTGRASVPILWDRKLGVIVNNESSDIIRMMNSEFKNIVPNTQNYFPEHLKSEIEKINFKIYENVNNGVYKAGFAITQEAYQEAVERLFVVLDWAEVRLGTHRYLCGELLTEADWRFFVTLLRFDCVYFSHFKCNRRMISDYTCLSNYMRELYQMPGISNTCNIEHIKTHYYGSQKTINPSGVIPVGPDTNWQNTHNRDRFFIR